MNRLQLGLKGMLGTAAGIARGERSNRLLRQSNAFEQAKIDRQLAADQETQDYHNKLLSAKDVEANQPQFKGIGSTESGYYNMIYDPASGAFRYEKVIDPIAPKVTTTPKTNSVDPVDLARLRGQAMDDSRASLNTELHTNLSPAQETANLLATINKQPPPNQPGRAPSLPEIYARADSNLTNLLGLPMSNVRVGGMTDDYVMGLLNNPGQVSSPGGGTNNPDILNTEFKTYEDAVEFTNAHPEYLSILEKDAVKRLPRRSLGGMIPVH